MTTAPYTFPWTGVPQGSYVLTAVATDNQTVTTTSAPVNVTVQAAAALYFVESIISTRHASSPTAQQAVWRWDQQEPFGVNAPDENPTAWDRSSFHSDSRGSMPIGKQGYITIWRGITGQTVVVM